MHGVVFCMFLTNFFFIFLVWIRALQALRQNAVDSKYVLNMGFSLLPYIFQYFQLKNCNKRGLVNKFVSLKMCAIVKNAHYIGIFRVLANAIMG